MWSAYVYITTICMRVGNAEELWKLASLPLWPTVVTVTISEDERTRSEHLHALRQSLVERASRGDRSDFKSNRGGTWHSEKEGNGALLDGTGENVDYLRTEVMAALKAHLQTYVSLGRDAPAGGTAKVRLSHSWANVALPRSPGAWNAPHVHGGCDLAGVVYLGCPRSGCTLILEDPRSALRLASALENRLSPEGKRGEVNVAEGAIVIFPCWLSHYAPPRESSDARISISFNAHVLLEIAGPPPLHLLYGAPQAASIHTVNVHFERGRIWKTLWPTYITLAEPAVQEKVTQQRLLRVLQDSPGQSGSSGHVGLTALREQIQAAVEFHLRAQAVGTDGRSSGKASVRIVATLTNMYTQVDIRNPHKHPDHDLSGVLGISGEHTIEFQDPRHSATSTASLLSMVRNGTEDISMGRFVGFGDIERLSIYAARVAVFPTWVDHFAEPRQVPHQVGSSLEGTALVSFGAKIDWHPGSAPFQIDFVDFSFSGVKPG